MNTSALMTPANWATPFASVLVTNCRFSLRSCSLRRGLPALGRAIRLLPSPDSSSSVAQATRSILIASSGQGESWGFKQMIRDTARRVVGLRSGPVDPVLRVAAPVLEPSACFHATETDPYVAFEDVFYDTHVASALMREYLPVLKPAAGQGPVLDLGVGRGEFLRLLLGAGLDAQGCEINAVEQETLVASGLPVTLADAASYLGRFEDGSVSAIAALHVVEHLEPDYLLRLLDLIGRRLRPGGVVLLETPNMLNWLVQQNFWLDITHIRPYPPLTLQYHLQGAGVRRFEIWYSGPQLPLSGPNADDRLNYGNVAIIGWK